MTHFWTNYDTTDHVIWDRYRAVDDDLDRCDLDDKTSRDDPRSLETGYLAPSVHSKCLTEQGSPIAGDGHFLPPLSPLLNPAPTGLH